MPKHPPFPTQYHPRRFGESKYVYPVVSRRSGGVSIGININPDGSCTFACVYCQVLADTPGEQPKGTLASLPYRPEHVDLFLLESELRKTVETVLSGAIFEEVAHSGIAGSGGHFAQTAPERRQLKDIAFSGDGEPTLADCFPEAVEIALRVRREFCPSTTKLVLITNATRLHLPGVRRAVARLAEANGEIWAKLDAGTEAFHNVVSRSRIPLAGIQENILLTAKERPVVIQTCLFRRENAIISAGELAAYTDRLRAIRDEGGTILRIQLYTIARKTPDAGIGPLSDEELDRLAETVRDSTGLVVETFYSR